jgi:hypothetical protein
MKMGRQVKVDDIVCAFPCLLVSAGSDVPRSSGELVAEQRSAAIEIARTSLSHS